jgi:hypothetical protein
MSFVRRIVLLAIAASALAAVVAGFGAARALADCSTETGVWWKMSTGGYGLAYGARNEITLTNHTLDSACTSSDRPEAQTSYLGLGGNYPSWVEAGWREYPCSGGYSGHCFTGFSEWGLNYVSHSVDERGYSCLAPGSTERWEMVNSPGTNNWNTWLDCEDGAGWRLLFQYSSTGYMDGTPAGEGSRRGPNTTMGETHKNLQWQDATNAWNYSSSVSCWEDNDSAWDGSAVTASRFDIVTGSNTCSA